MNRKVNQAVEQLNTGEVDFIGRSAAFYTIMETIQTVASRRCSIMITGETGTGKEIIARWIHANSPRHKSVFVPVDCSSLTGQLFESQLFGHVKGAFTGAYTDTIGFFRAANHGTIFLDEIGELSFDLQAKLLRVLQDSCVTPVGSTQSHKVDVRVLCATNRDLKTMLNKGSFRADLYYRLNVVTLEVPPLRERKEDILVLANHFLKAQAEFYGEPAKKLHSETEKLLVNYSWPGNVRELANVIEHAYVFSQGLEIKPEVLPLEISVIGAAVSEAQVFPTLNEVKKKLILQALKRTNGRKIAAAKLLGIERRALNRLIEKFNISTPVK
ncbi:MAG: sigma-54 dependent transcriptional regulator [Planctomycetota bacterium]